MTVSAVARPAAARPAEARPAAAIPLRLPSRRVWIGGVALSLAGVAMIAVSPLAGFVDFPQFWSAGATVGTPDLLDPGRHFAWQTAQGVALGYFVYPPGVAWMYAPFAAIPLVAAFWLNAVLMTALVAAAGLLGARTYGLGDRVGLIAAFAWTPCMASAILGQNAALGLVLSLLAIEGLRRDSDVLAGLAVGLLLYKPTLALPLLALLALRLRWRAVLVVAVVAAGWYLASVAATAGDWQWPAQWLSVVGDYYAQDTAANVERAISIPGLLQGFGVPQAIAGSAALVVAFLAIPRLRKSPIAEAGAGAVLLGVLVSPHALNYDGALMLPAMFWLLGGQTTGIAEPARTRLVVAAYLIAPEYLISWWLGLSVLGMIAAVATVIWISGWRRVEGGPQAESSTQHVGAAPVKARAKRVRARPSSA